MNKTYPGLKEFPTQLDHSTNTPCEPAKYKTLLSALVWDRQESSKKPEETRSVNQKRKYAERSGG